MKPTFTLPTGCDPLAASDTDGDRPWLANGFIARVAHPLTGERGVYLVTSDSYVAAFVPLAARGWRGRKSIAVAPDAIRKVMEGPNSDAGTRYRRELVLDGRRACVDGNTYAPTGGASTPPDFEKVCKTPERVVDGHPRAAFNQDLLVRLTKALGWRKHRVRSSGTPVKVTLSSPLRPVTVEVVGGIKGAFGVLMPIRLPEDS